MYVINFSKMYSKLNNEQFTTIRRYDYNYKVGATYIVRTIQGWFKARLIKKEKKQLQELSNEFLCSDTDTYSRASAIRVLNSFYVTEIGNYEYVYVLHFKKIKGGE